MRIGVKLYSTLREALPAENKGQAVLDLPAQETLSTLLEELGIHNCVVISVNESHETDLDLLVKEGDFVRIFHPVGGGSQVKGDSHV